MRIAMVSGHPSPLAAEGPGAGSQRRHVAALSTRLSRKGHEVTVYTRRDDPDLDTRVRDPAGYHVVYVPAGPAEPLSTGDLLAHTNDFARFLASEWSLRPPEVAHTHSWLSGLAGLTVHDRVGVPIVQTFHTLGAVERRHRRHAGPSLENRIALEQLIGGDASRVAATCTDEVFELVRMGVPRWRISLVPSGVDLGLFTPDGPRAPKYLRHRLVAAGDLVPRKGFDIAIQALRDLPDTELVIAGGPRYGDIEDDDEAQRLLDCADLAGVSDRVWLPGRLSRDDMPTLLRSADAVVCTPWYEPFGMLALEAMACGVPVVAAAVGGLTDSVVDGVTGELVPPRHPTALAGAVRRVVANRATTDAYGIAGRERVTARYSWDRIATAMMRTYRRALTDQPAAVGAVAL